MEQIVIPSGSDFERRVSELRGSDLFAVAREGCQYVGNVRGEKACQAAQNALAAAMKDLDGQLEGLELLIAGAMLTLDAMATTLGIVDSVHMQMETQSIEKGEM